MEINNLIYNLIIHSQTSLAQYESVKIFHVGGNSSARKKMALPRLDLSKK